jgi:hypothetical protein
MSVRRWALLGAFCLLVVVVRLAASSAEALSAARAHEASGKAHEAAVVYGRAIHLYLPLSPVPGRAGEALVGLAEAAEDRGELLEARFCWEELRSSFLSVRSFYQPGRRFVDLAQERLVPLMLQDPRGSWPDPSLAPEERAAILQRVLAEREDPALGWVLVMGLGYGMWLGGAALAILRGVPRDDGAAVLWPVVGRWAAGSAAGYALWLLAVARA